MKLALDGSPRFVVCQRFLRRCDRLPVRVLREPFIEFDEGPLLCSSEISSALTIALTGHSGTQTEQSMHSEGSITRKFGPSRKQSIGQTLTQSVYLQRMQASVTTNGMGE